MVETTRVDLRGPAPDRDLQRARLGADVSLELARSLDVDATLQTAARALGQIADVVVVEIDDARGRVRRVVGDRSTPFAIHEREETLTTLVTLTAMPDVGAAASASIDGRGAHLAELRDGGAKTAIAAPLFARGRVVGNVWLGSVEGALDAALIADLAERIALAVDNARVHRAAKAASANADQMLYVISHDLRNPLSNVQMASDELLARAPESCHRHLEIIRRATRQMNRLIQDVLDLTRLEAGRFSLDRADCDLAPAIRDGIAACSAIAEARGVDVLATSAGETRAYCDRDKIAHVVAKLVDNAIKASERGGKITVALTVSGAGEARIVVSDSGRGMDAEQVSHAFDRAYNAARKDRRGPGLGLAVARGTVEAHGGQVSIASEPGKGTQVTVVLPARAA